MTRRRATALWAAGATIAMVVAPGSAAAQPAPASARNILLCQGDALPCDTARQSSPVGDEHVVMAVVTDATGDPVGDVPVEFRQEGYGRFTTGGAVVVVATGADGKALASVVADTAGWSSVFAVISPPGTPGGFRGPAADDDECEQQGDADGVPAAGNCTAGPVTVDWTAPPPDPPECSDGLDNDPDGFVDYPDDPGCWGPEDSSEAGFERRDARWARKVSLQTREWNARRLLALGRVRVAEGGPAGCVAHVPVAIQRRSPGRWKTVLTASTDAGGWYVAAVPHRVGRFRAVAARFEILDERAGRRDTCLRARNVTRHRHA